MGLLRRKRNVDPESRLDELHSGHEEHRATLHVGVPGRCPSCDGFGYIDHIDMVNRYQRQHCRSCGHRWEFDFDDDGDVIDLTEFADDVELPRFRSQLTT